MDHHGSFSSGQSESSHEEGPSEKSDTSDSEEEDSDNQDEHYEDALTTGITEEGSEILTKGQRPADRRCRCPRGLQQGSKIDQDTQGTASYTLADFGAFHLVVHAVHHSDGARLLGSVGADLTGVRLGCEHL